MNLVISSNLNKKNVIVMNFIDKETKPPSSVRALGLPPRLNGEGPDPN